VETSALRKIGLDDLLAVIERVLADEMVTVTYLIPYALGELLAAVHDSGIVEEEIHTGDGVQVKARVPIYLAGRLERALGSTDEMGA
jgi:50S ribosomal subunit-associated GTPase HflX